MIERDARMGPYVLLEPIGKGGQGSVWLARDQRAGGVVALKILRDDLRGPKEAARFRREAAILTSMRDVGLPACLHLLEQPEGVPVALAMEFVKGKPLSEENRQRRLSPQDIRAMTCELARVAAVLHAKGLVHRDIKASNILLRQGWQNGVPGSVVLVDLGIAKGTAQHATSHTEPGFIVGSVAALAPELLLQPDDAQQASPQLDVYSIGVLLWLLMFGCHPTGLEMRADVLDILEAYMGDVVHEPEPEHLQSIERSLPGLTAIARRCVQYDPAKRYANARDVHLALASLGPSGSTKVCVEAAAVSYNVEIHPRPEPLASVDGQDAPPSDALYATIDVESEAPTNVRLCPPPEPTVDEPVSGTILELRRQFGDALEDDAPLEAPRSTPKQRVPPSTLPYGPVPAPVPAPPSPPSGVGTATPWPANVPPNAVAPVKRSTTLMVGVAIALSVGLLFGVSVLVLVLHG